MAVELANQKIAQAREGDGNEGLTINDVTPDWIRTRGSAMFDVYTQNGWSLIGARLGLCSCLRKNLKCHILLYRPASIPANGRQTSTRVWTLQSIKAGAALLENFFVDYRGGASTRTGTKYILKPINPRRRFGLSPSSQLHCWLCT